VLVTDETPITGKLWKKQNKRAITITSVVMRILGVGN
jgi:hypothetical protein